MYKRIMLLAGKDFIKRAAGQIETIRNAVFNDDMRTATISTARTIIKMSYELAVTLGEVDTYRYIIQSISYSEHHGLKAA